MGVYVFDHAYGPLFSDIQLEPRGLLEASLRRIWRGKIEGLSAFYFPPQIRHEYDNKRRQILGTTVTRFLCNFLIKAKIVKYASADGLIIVNLIKNW